MTAIIMVILIGQLILGIGTAILSTKLSRARKRAAEQKRFVRFMPKTSTGSTFERSAGYLPDRNEKPHHDSELVGHAL